MGPLEWNDREIEFAHALYTVALHAKQQGQTLILDRVRGAAERCPTLLERHPDLREILSLPDDSNGGS